jgi:hypothetical protein
MRVCKQEIIRNLLWASPSGLFLALRMYFEQAAMPSEALFVFALVWGLLLLQALDGLGLLVVAAAQMRLAGWGIQAAIGLAVLICIGGWLNWFSAANDHNLTVVIWIGVAISVAGRIARLVIQPQRGRRLSAKSSKTLLGLCAMVSLVLIWRYLLSAAWPVFNGHDDFHAYLVFPTKLLEFGSLGSDPFSERRLVSGLGGQYLLLASVGTQLPARFWHLFDPGIALLLTAVLFFDAIRDEDQALKFRSLPMLVLLGICLITPTAANVTAEYTVLPLFIALVLLFDKTQRLIEVGTAQRRSVEHAFLGGLLAAAACTLKNTFIPFVCLFLAGYFALTFTAMRGKRAPLIGVALSVLLAMTVLLLPWMLDLKRSSGTLLYPLLGRGFHGSVYGSFPIPSGGFLTLERFASSVGSLAAAVVSLLFLCNAALAVTGLLKWQLRDFRVQLGVVVSLSALLTVGAIWIGTGGWGTYRYSSPVLLSASVASLLLLSAESTASKFRPYGIWGVGLMMVGYGWSQFEGGLKQGVAAVRQSARGQNLYTQHDVNAYEQVNRTLPSDGAVLARVAMPFLLKQRADLFIADYPGGASPPPGLPLGSTAENMARYLRENRIRYILWDYGREAGFGRDDFSHRLDPREHPWLRAEANATFQFHGQLENLRSEYRVIYELDGIAIIDLSRSLIQESLDESEKAR